MNIADRISILRKSRGISQEELADKIGVSRQAVSKWESGQSTPDIDRIILLSDYFKTTTDYLLKGIESAKETEDKWNAMLFSIAGTILNAIGLVFAIIIWWEQRRAYAAGIGIIFMLVGIELFVTGKIVDTKDKLKAKHLFIFLNVWILLFIPGACCFNILNGLRGGYWWGITPVPMIGNSIITFELYWIVYIAICAAVDIIVVKLGA